MPRKTDGEKVNDLEKLVATLVERVDNLRGEVESIAESATRIAVFEERLNELKRVGEESSRKLWSLLPPLLGALLGAALTLLVQQLLQFVSANPN